MNEMNSGKMKTMAKAELIKWLSPVDWDWDWFCTFSYTRPLLNGDEERRSIWNTFLRELMDSHRDTLGYVWVEEQSNPTDSLARIDVHYHALLVSNRAPDCSNMERLWRDRAGNGRRRGHASVVIEPYDPSLGGVGYAFKLLNRNEVTWDLGNLEFFFPVRPEGWDRDRFSRRRFRRDLLRKQAALRDQEPALVPANNWLTI